jgi:hypothetical protein
VIGAKKYAPFPKNVPVLNSELQQLLPPDQLSDDQMRQIDAELARVKPVLDRARENASLSRGRYELADAPDIIPTLLPNADA